MDCLDFRGLGILDGVVVVNVPAPAIDPPPLLPLRFIETGPNVVRRGFGGRGMMMESKRQKSGQRQVNKKATLMTCDDGQQEAGNK